MECEEVERGRQREAEYRIKKGERKREKERLSEKGRGVYYPLMALTKSRGAGFISGVCHRGDSCSHQHQPRGIQISNQEKKKKEKTKAEKYEKSKKKKPRASPLQFPSRCQKSKERRRRRRRRRPGGGVCGVTVNGIESTTASSHSPVAPKHTALFANAQKKKKTKKKKITRGADCRASVFI